MRTTYQNTSMRFGFFRACALCAKNPECSGSVNGTTKNPGFLDFGFGQCKWASCRYKLDICPDEWFYSLVMVLVGTCPSGE